MQAMASAWVKEVLPGYQLISEEMAPFNTEWDARGSYVVLDPIDGTENFISGLKEWGIGVSIYHEGVHQESCIYLPELDKLQLTGMPIQRHRSRIVGLSSSLTHEDLARLPWKSGVEFRIVGCAMYNLLMASRGSFMFLVFEHLYSRL